VPRHKKVKRRPAIPVHLIDTNVILRYLMGDDPPRAARAAALMERLEYGEEAVELPDEVLTETVWTLESFYGVPHGETAEKLTALLTSRVFGSARVTFSWRHFSATPPRVPTSWIVYSPPARANTALPSTPSTRPISGG
jgi:predicted nucleic acid-binding protein